MQKEARWIRLREIAKVAEDVLGDEIIDNKKVRELDLEVSAMLRSLASNKTFFKRLS